MRSSSTPLILLTNSATNAVQAAAGTNGLWSTTAISNDTYQTPGITFGNGMDGNVAVWVSRAQDIYGHVLSPATNVITLVVHSTPPPAPVVAITNPANGTLLTNNQSFAIRGTLSSTNFSGGVVEIYANGTALGAAALSGASSPYSFALNTSLTGGSYSLQAVATDASGLSTTSSVAHVTVETPGSVLIDFEALDASAAAVGGTKLSNYLAGFGVKATNVTPGTSLAAAGYNVFLGGTVAGPAPADGSNFLAQTGPTGRCLTRCCFRSPTRV
jgi:hypothetical protein